MDSTAGVAVTRSGRGVLTRSFVVLCAVALAGVPVAGTASGEPDGSSGQLVPVAGIGEDGYSGDGQRATDARISEHGTIAVGPDGTLYLADERGRRVRAVNEDGVIDTVPGTRALRSPATDGPEGNGMRRSPSDRPLAVTVSQDGTLYVLGSETIRRLGPDGSAAVVVETDATGIGLPGTIKVDGSGNLYVSGGSTIVRVDPAGIATKIGGGGSLNPFDANGKPATEARLGEYGAPFAVAPDGTVYVLAAADGGDRAALYEISPDGTLHSITGGNESGFAGDGGPVTKARLSERLSAVDVAEDGTVYVADTGNNLVRAIDGDGVITSLAPALPAGEEVSDLAVGPRGDVYLKTGARVRKLTDDGQRSAPRPREPSYPARFPQEPPGTVHAVVNKLNPAAPPNNSAEQSYLRLAVGPDGTRYYSDTGRVMKMTPDGEITVFAGTGKAGFSGDGGPATQAALSGPAGLDVAQDGSVYIADAGNYRLRKVDPAGVITTVAGNGNMGDRGGDYGDEIAVHGDGGPATAATVTPTDVTVAADGSLYLAEGDNSRISRIAPDGTISTVGGLGDRWQEQADGRPATEADFYRPSAVAVGPDGTVYLLDGGAERTWPSVRMIDTAGTMHTVAGDSYREEDEAGFGGDGGPGTAAELNSPHDIAAGQDGTLYIADTYNARVRAVDATGTITTIAGTGQPADSGDDGAATEAALNEPQTIDVDASGALHVINGPGDRIRTVANGVITTAGTLSSAPMPGQQQPILDPIKIAIDDEGALLFTNRFGGMFAAADAGNPTAEQLETFIAPNSAEAVAVGPDGTRYIAANGVVYRLPEKGPGVPVVGGGPGTGRRDQVSRGQQATTAAFESIVDLAIGAKGRLHIATPTGVYRLGDDGTLDSLVRRDGDTKVSPAGIAVDDEDRLFLADTKANRVYGITADGGRITVAGNGSDSSPEDDEDGAEATEVALAQPSDVAVDSAGNLYVSKPFGIYRVDTDGEIMRVADGYGSLGSLAFDRHGDLYYVEGGNNRISVVVQPGQLTTPFDWSTPIWLTVGALTLFAAGWLGLRYRRGRSEPITLSELAADKKHDTEPETA